MVTRTNAAAIRKCHSHQVACQFRANATAISASASSANAAVTATIRKTGRRERVQSEEARAAEEGERDEEHARVAAAAGGLAHDETERRTHRGDPEDQPEVGAVVLPVDV